MNNHSGTSDEKLRQRDRDNAALIDIIKLQKAEIARLKSRRSSYPALKCLTSRINGIVEPCKKLVKNLF